MPPSPGRRRRPATPADARQANHPDHFFSEVPMIHRSALHALAAAVLLAGTASAVAAPPPATLKQAYADAFLLGTAVNDEIVSGKDARAQALATRHFNAITAENVMKVEVLH